MAKLNYKQFGEGEPLIIMHGLYGSSDNWVSIAKELMGGFKIYLLDIRNHGRSPHFPEHNYDVLTDDLLEFMNDKQIFSAIIMGHSMGGKIAMSFTLLQPERVKKLIVVDVSPRSYSDLEGDQQFKEHKLILEAIRSVDLSMVKSRNEVDQYLATHISSEKVRQFLMKNLTRTKEHKFYWRINVDVLLNSIENVVVGIENDLDAFKYYQGEVLFVRGERSNYIQSKDEELILENFNNVAITTIAKASHWVHAEQPKEFVNVVLNFL